MFFFNKTQMRNQKTNTCKSVTNVLKTFFVWKKVSPFFLPVKGIVNAIFGTKTKNCRLKTQAYAFFLPVGMQNYELIKIVLYGVSLFIIVSLVVIYTVIQASFYNLNDTKRAEYECGFEPFDFCSRKPFHVHFYLVGILFVLFDVEVSMLYPWAHEFWDMNQIVYHAGQFFVMLILVGVLYEWVKKAIEWKTTFISLMFDPIAWIATFGAKILPGLFLAIFLYDIGWLFDNSIVCGAFDMNLVLQIDMSEQENYYYLFSREGITNLFLEIYPYSLILLDQNFSCETTISVPLFAESDEELRDFFSVLVYEDTNNRFYYYIVAEIINSFCSCKDNPVECTNKTCHLRMEIAWNFISIIYYWIVAVSLYYSILYFVDKTYLFFKNIWEKDEFKEKV